MIFVGLFMKLFVRPVDLEDRDVKAAAAGEGGGVTE